MPSSNQNIEFPWQRYWCEPGKFKYEQSYFFWGLSVGPYGPDIKAHTFAEINDKACLVLLGEPGMGKSWTLHSEYEALEVPDSQKLFLNLNTCPTSYDLDKRLFKDPRLASARENGHVCHVFLDSFDECHALFPSLSDSLINDLCQSVGSLEKVRLRIACRSCLWPATLDESLANFFKLDEIAHYELLPLARKHIVEACSQLGVNSEAFFREVTTREIEVLAVTPLTSVRMLSMFADRQRLPDRQSELYEHMVYELVREQNLKRRESRDERLIGKVDAKHRFLTAAYLAAISIFTNRPLIQMEQQNKSDDVSINVEDIQDTTFVFQGAKKTVTHGMLHETLETALFSVADSNRHFIHRSLAEFLAGWFMSNIGASHEQLLQLLRHPENSKGRIVPYLRGTTAWIADLIPEMLPLVASSDPKVCLASDLTNTPTGIRALVVQHLLESFQQLRENDFDFISSSRYSRLKHPGLADQLRPFIVDLTANFVVRRAAIELAESCEIDDVQDEILSVALDHEEEPHIRRHAVHALVQIGDPDIRRRLLPLAEGIGDADPNDDIKGYALRALWPDVLSAKELFPLLAPVKNDHHIGGYYIFIASEVPRSLKAEDFPAALEWVKTLTTNRPLGLYYEHAAERIIGEACKYLDSSAVRESLTDVAWIFLRRIGNPFSRTEAEYLWKPEGDSIRRKLPLVLMQGVEPENQADLSILTYRLMGPSLLSTDDLTWLFEEFRKTNDKGDQLRIAEIAYTLFNSSGDCSAKLLNEMLELADISTDFHHIFRFYVEPVLLDYEQAQAERTSFENLQAKEKKREERQRKLKAKNPNEPIDDLLFQIEAGCSENWQKIVGTLSAYPDLNSHLQIRADITQNSYWSQLDHQSHDRILDAAAQYIVDYSPYNLKNADEYELRRCETAGYKALFHLVVNDNQFVEGIPVQIWKAWIHPIVFSDIGNTDEKEGETVLARLAYDHVPKLFIRMLDQCIDQQDEEGHISVTHKLSSFIDTEIQNLLFTKLKSSRLSAKGFGELLHFLLKNNIEDARQLALAHLEGPFPFEHDDRARAVEASNALLLHTNGTEWPEIWNALQADREFGIALILGLAKEHRVAHMKFPLAISENAIADLYSWLAREFPEKEDPDSQGRLSARASIGQFRNACLRHLSELATQEARSALDTIVEEFPENQNHLKWIRNEAETEFLRKSWNPPTMVEFLSLLDNADKRLVRSKDELLQIVMDSLKRLEIKFQQGELPAATDVWNIDNGICMPKDELEFASRIARHLRNDLHERGIVANREVQIKRGSFTDIYISGIGKDEKGDKFATFTIVIEVKGCWHKDIETAMQYQLVEKYLGGNDLTHGIYLIGWFGAKHWDIENRKKRDRKGWCARSIEKTRTFFDAQAEEISNETGRTIKAFVLDASL